MDNDLLTHIHVETLCNVKTKTVAFFLFFFFFFFFWMFTSRSGYLQNGEKRQINPCLHRKNKDDRPGLV